jgi:hypothetical protein
VASTNTTSCKLFENAINNYNDVGRADRAGRTDQTLADIRFMLLALPGRLQDAFDKATGDVAVTLQTSKDEATRLSLNSVNPDATAWGQTVEPVVIACTQEGVNIVIVP